MIKPINFNFRGTDYPMILDLYALEQIEEELGGMSAMQEKLRGGKEMFSTLRKLFKIFANAGLEAEDREETVTGKEIRRASLEEMVQFSEVVQQLIYGAKKTETSAGQIASDEHQEIYQDDEDDEKNG